MGELYPGGAASVQVKSRERVAAHGEVFTNEREVNAMLDLVKQETERLDSRFLEPACGDGNFLIEILRRKLAICESRVRSKQYSQLQYEQNAVLAVSSIYGIELLQDNALACRERLLQYFATQYRALFGDRCKDACIESVRYILSKNIIIGDALTYKRVDEPDKWITISEWSFIGEGKVNRRDYEFSYLVGEDSGSDLFSDLPIETFKPVHFLKINRETYGE
ncbi:MAG: SAM-dependent DNA methyltransferase [Bacteroidales bacterium]|nr:SAM-dependent DNA methyltransferase [Bacteroidales bacterium]